MFDSENKVNRGTYPAFLFGHGRLNDGCRRKSVLAEVMGEKPDTRVVLLMDL